MAYLVIRRLPRPSSCHALINRRQFFDPPIKVHVPNLRSSVNSVRFLSSNTSADNGTTTPTQTKTTTTTPQSSSIPIFPSSPRLIAEAMMVTHKGTLIERTQLLDANQLQKLCITLGRKHLAPGQDQDMTKGPPPQGTPLPPGYHLVYFTPSDLEADLGPDGTDQPFSPPAPFTRRMWAGGKLTWNLQNPLCVGDMVTEQTKLISIEPKVNKQGKDMLIANVQKEFFTDKGLALQERRVWVFQAPNPSNPIDDTNAHVKQPTGEETTRLTAQLGGEPSSVEDFKDTGARDDTSPVRSFKWSPKALFRFSALTFNAHMIHYDDPWTKFVEGHLRTVVHGPLNLINMLDYWRDVHGQEGKLHPVELTYKAISPVYSRERYFMTSQGEAYASGGTCHISVHKPKKDKAERQLCMTGEISGRSQHHDTLIQMEETRSI